jgi:hypothetical protein
MPVSRRIQLPPKLVKDLRAVSKLSSKNRWEYGGKADFKIKHGQFVYKGLTYATSNERRRIDASALKSEWTDAPIAYHTHPTVLKETPDDSRYTIFTTLPSAADFEAFIKGFPDMQVNIICDAHGYYVIDIFESAKKLRVPLPHQVDIIMREVRYEDFLLKRGFGEEKCEYFHTELLEWKVYVNDVLCPHLRALFGISICFYGYEDTPPTTIIYA